MKWVGYTETKDKDMKFKQVCSVNDVETCILEMKTELAYATTACDYFIECIHNFNGLEGYMRIIRLRYDPLNKKWFVIK